MSLMSRCNGGDMRSQIKFGVEVEVRNREIACGVHLARHVTQITVLFGRSPSWNVASVLGPTAGNSARCSWEAAG